MSSAVISTTSVSAWKLSYCGAVTKPVLFWTIGPAIGGSTVTFGGPSSTTIGGYVAALLNHESEGRLNLRAAYALQACRERLPVDRVLAS